MFFLAARAAFASSEESKVVSFHSFMLNPRQVVRAFVIALFLSVLPAVAVSPANAQTATFTLTVLSPLSPPAVDPTGSSVAILNLQPIGSFSGTVSLTCAVTTGNSSAVSPPTCQVSPASATPPATPALTVTTTSPTSPGQYIITVTAISGSTTVLLPLTLAVEPVTESYNLSATPTTASPDPVTAGGEATTTVTVTPSVGYSGSVTLACLSISPVVTPSPICSFNPPTVTVGSTTVQPTSILTITTSGPTPVTKLRVPRIFYALWLAIPGLVVLRVRATGELRKTILGIFFLTTVASSLLFLPACSSSKTTDNNGVTPNNSYTFTLTGADANGAAPSSTTLATVTATVN
jgi:hypothetical protein